MRIEADAPLDHQLVLNGEHFYHVLTRKKQPEFGLEARDRELLEQLRENDQHKYVVEPSIFNDLSDRGKFEVLLGYKENVDEGIENLKKKGSSLHWGIGATVVGIGGIAYGIYGFIKGINPPTDSGALIFAIGGPVIIRNELKRRNELKSMTHELKNANVLLENARRKIS